MLKTFAAALTILSLTAVPVSADLSNKFGRASKKPVKTARAEMLPPPGYKGQWWTAPNRCEYSRAGRPGETVWYLIINTAHRKCDAYLVQRGFKDAY
ncbi:hypothetical protein [Arenibacterium halophilum]|uniref:Uncharacterized protein n=1 Tax=Arenibacterium halophilum TaxID=2583821 RepID=A0ABY2X879_9RHOB|nr:hypothetical protein [Arenibacterium halophilum]TMV12568.1 hypothetical protein FGK64_07065 [Arenibacterium halophilum]